MARKPIEVEEIQISGVQDDGTSEGIIRAKIIAGELVALPANAIDVASGSFGTGSISDGDNMYQNPDGSGSSINITSPAALGAGIGIAQFIIYGSTIGIRYRRTFSSPMFNVLIDGVPYEISKNQQNPYLNNLPFNSQLGDRECLVILAENLGNRAHSVEVIVQPNGVSSGTLVVFGFIVDRKAGYKERLASDFVFQQGTLSTSPSTIDRVNSGGIKHRGIKRIIYTNNDVAAIIVTVTLNAVVLWKKSIAAASTEILDISDMGLAGVAANFQHSASVVAMVTFNAITSM